MDRACCQGHNTLEKLIIQAPKSRNLDKMRKPTKTSGAVYTPSHIVKNILNLVGYDSNILKKHIIDNSCGDGAFLYEIVERYITEYLRENHDISTIKTQLETYIHGLELDDSAIKKCRESLDELVAKYGIKEVMWDVRQANTLEVSDFDGKMDYVVGNPPYIRVHNLKESYTKVKEYSFANNGMTDLYIVFFEISFRMLNATGRLGLITPSSYLRSRAGINLRKFLQKTQGLTKVVDLGHYQAFKATTYTMITVFDNSSQSSCIEYYIYDEERLLPKKVEDLDYKTIFVGDSMYFSSACNLSLLHEIESYWEARIDRGVIVKNGFATLADDVFIGDFDFTDCTIDVIKASTGKWTKCIFPYHKDGKPFSLDEIEKHSDVYNYLLTNKDVLDKKDSEKKEDWFLFGRSQAILDVSRDKISINTTIKDINSIKLNFVGAGKGLYSGLYILSKHTFADIMSVIQTDEFITYLSLLKNYKSSGYYSFSSMELEKYLNFKLEGIKIGQPNLFGHNFQIV